MTELTLAQIIQVGRRWWWILVIGTLLGGMAGWAAASRAESSYQADAKLLLDRSSLSSAPDNSASAYNNILAAERLTQTFGQLVTTRTVLNESLARMGEEANGMTASSLEAALTVTVIPDTQIIKIDATDPDPDRAALIVNTVAEVFASQAATIRPEISVENADALQASIDDIVGQMEETQRQITELEARSDANSGAIQTQLRDLRTQLGQDQSRHAELVETQQRMTINAAESGVLVKIVDPAVASGTPVNSNPSFLLFAGLLTGFILAGGVVFVLGYLDNTVKDPADVQRITGRNALGLIPSFEHPEQFEALTDLRSPPAEAFRALRTNLQFATVGKVVRSLVLTSAAPGEGTTTTATYLAMVLSQGGQRIILVDANLRHPSLHRVADVANRAGVTNLLLGDSLESVEDYLRSTDLEHLKILTSGPLPPNPADLLNSRRMEDLIKHLELKADLVIIDCPPLRYADALIVTGMSSGALVVAASGKTRSNDLADAIGTIEQTGRPIFGTILNKARVPRGERETQSPAADARTAGPAIPTNSTSKRRSIAGLLSR